MRVCANPAVCLVLPSLVVCPTPLAFMRVIALFSGFEKTFLLTRVNNPGTFISFFSNYLSWFAYCKPKNLSVFFLLSIKALVILHYQQPLFETHPLYKTNPGWTVFSCSKESFSLLHPSASRGCLVHLALRLHSSVLTWVPRPSKKQGGKKVTMFKNMQEIVIKK